MIVIQDIVTRANAILGFLRRIPIVIKDQLLLQGKIKDREFTVEPTSNRRHHLQVILVVIHTQTQVTMTTRMTKKAMMAGAEEGEVQNAAREDYRLLEIDFPVRKAYQNSCNNLVHLSDQ